MSVLGTTDPLAYPLWVDLVIEASFELESTDSVPLRLTARALFEYDFEAKVRFFRFEKESHTFRVIKLSAKKIGVYDAHFSHQSDM